MAACGKLLRAKWYTHTVHSNSSQRYHAWQLRHNWLAATLVRLWVMRHDRDIVLHACHYHGAVLHFAARSLRTDREIVTHAVANDGMALRFASHELRSDAHIVARACRQNPHALQFASKAVRRTMSLLLYVVQKDAEVVKFAPKDKISR